MNERPLEVPRRQLTRFVGATNLRSGDCLSWLLVTLKVIRAACKLSHVSFKFRASLKIKQYLFAALFRSFYLPQAIARCAQYQCRRIAESSFSSFMASQQLPFR